MLKVEHLKEGDNSEIVDLLKAEHRIEQQAWKRKPILKRLKRSNSDNNSQETQTREPISIFQEITKVEDQSKKQNLKDLLKKLKSFCSDDLKIGVALKTGDCFFDSVYLNPRR